jgi:hypothetical protein
LGVFRVGGGNAVWPEGIWMFTLEIKGRAVAVIYADEENARELLDDEDFQEDLQALESNGEPIWNGKDKLTVRPASESDIAAADGNADDDDPDDDEEDEEGELMVVFIVPLDDDEDDDEADA